MQPHYWMQDPQQISGHWTSGGSLWRAVGNWTLALGHSLNKMDRLKECRVKMVAVFSDSQTMSIRTTHLEVVQGLRLAKQVHWRDQNIPAHVIATYLHFLPGQSSITANEYTHCHGQVAQQASSSTVIVWPNTSASNTARHSAEGWSAAREMWEADKWSNPCSSRGKGRGNQDTYCDDKREVAGCHVLQTAFRACTHWSLHKIVQAPRGWPMLVVPEGMQDRGPDVETHRLPFQPVKTPAKDTM